MSNLASVALVGSFFFKFYAFPVRCSDIFLMILRWFQPPLLLLVSLLICTCIMRCISFVRSSYLEPSRLLSWSHFRLLKFQHLLTHTRSFFIITNYDDQRWFCRFAPVDSIIWLPYFQDLFLLNLIQLYQCSLSNFAPISLHTLKYNLAHTLSCLCMYVLLLLLLHCVRFVRIDGRNVFLTDFAFQSTASSLFLKCAVLASVVLISAVIRLFSCQKKIYYNDFVIPFPCTPFYTHKRL